MEEEKVQGTYEKKGLVYIDKKFRLYPYGKHQTALEAGVWHNEVSVLEKLLWLPLPNGLDTVQPPREEMLMNRNRKEKKRKQGQLLKGQLAGGVSHRDLGKRAA